MPAFSRHNESCKFVQAARRDDITWLRGTEQSRSAKRTVGRPSGLPVLTVGVDLSADSSKTGLATIKWASGHAEVTDLVVGADDARLVESIAHADKAGIDCPLGWPLGFIDFVNAHDTGSLEVPAQSAAVPWRRQLVYRQTDLVVRATTGRWPLSVSADRIGHTAMRAGALLARLAAGGESIDRAGAGVIVEVYPAASLGMWDLPNGGYKGRPRLVQLSGLVDALMSAAPWLGLGAFESLCRISDDATDAVVAALTARAAALGLTSAPSSEQLPVARREGWIALPTAPLDSLRGAIDPDRSENG
jgi:predicted nuclease with RNAse H fold